MDLLHQALNKGNLLKGIGKKTGGRGGMESVKVFSLMFSSQKHTFYMQTKWFEIAVFFKYNF